MCVFFFFSFYSLIVDGFVRSSIFLLLAQIECIRAHPACFYCVYEVFSTQFVWNPNICSCSYTTTNMNAISYLIHSVVCYSPLTLSAASLAVWLVALLSHSLIAPISLSFSLPVVYRDFSSCLRLIIGKNRWPK